MKAFGLPGSGAEAWRHPGLTCTLASVKQTGVVDKMSCLMCPGSYIFLPPYIKHDIRAFMANFILTVSMVTGNVGFSF